MNKAISPYKLIVLWAILGGITLFSVVIINVISVLGVLFSFSFPGDFEITAMGTAISVFSFLPYCQMTNANVSADIFTVKASLKTIAIFTLLGNILAFIFSAVLFYQMFLGMIDQKEYGYTTTILQIPHWLAFIPILFSLLLLIFTTILSIKDNLLFIFNTKHKG